jgi:glycosyltransferase involved in cell wall biosynthesis
MTHPALSILIPAYNMARWLPYAVESCLWQTRPDIEVVIVNDGSRDDTPAIAEAYAKADARVRTHHQQNMGLGRTREVGQKLARGRFLMWLDADDFLDRDAARDMLAVAEADRVNMVCGNAVVFSDRTFNTRRYFFHPEAHRTSFDNPRYWKSKVTWRWIINTEFINASGARHPALKLGQDVVLMYDLLARVGSFSQCPSFFYYFRQEHKGIDSSLETEVEHQLAHYALVKDILVGHGRIKPLVKYLSENYLRDVRNLAPRLAGTSGPWLSRVVELGMETFAGIDPQWLTAASAGPEVDVDPRLLPLAQALIRRDAQAAAARIGAFAADCIEQVDKTCLWHTLRRRIKACFAPLSVKARRRQAQLEALARKRLGPSWPPAKN